MSKLERIIDLQKLLLQFNYLERTLLLPRSAGKGDRNETDTEHSYSLAMIAWYVSQDLDHLDSNKCIRYALVHDLLELHAGDTFAYGDASVQNTKNAREAAAVAKLQQDWADFGDLHEAIQAYEQRSDAESRFVYALDKIMPMIINYLSDGINYQKHGVILDDVKRVKAAKVAVSPEVQALYDELITLFEAKPQLFGSAAV